MRRRTDLRAPKLGSLAVAGLVLAGAVTAAASEFPAIRGGTAAPPDRERRPAVAQEDSSLSYSFVVLGHLRGLRDGGLAYNLAELLDEVRELKPDFAVLTGDLIWGDTQTNPADSLRVVSEWNALDSALATLHTPIYRVPGNHDINDLVTRDIFFDRYGSIPRAVDVHGSRLFLLGSGWIPADGDRRKHLFVRGRDLDSAQVAFLRNQLADPSEYRHAFVFMHHLLWWEEYDAPWWREVHPILARGGVRAVFSGDYGPEKFSHLRQDGIDYYQSGIAPNPPLAILRGHEWNRILAQQFDNYLYVTVAGPDVKIDVRTVSEVASGHFTPQRWRDVYGRIHRPPPPGGRARIRALWEHPRGRLAALGALGLAFLLGLGIGRALPRDR